MRRKRCAKRKKCAVPKKENKRRFELIDKESAGIITTEEKQELEDLQRRVDKHLAPLDKPMMRRLKRALTRLEKMGEK